MKRKLSLRVEDLQVDEFATTPVAKKRGTVYGAETNYSNCTCNISCNTESCGPTCGELTCAYTCDGFITYLNPHNPCVAC